MEIERSMYLLEAERLKYLLACYLRTRLKKVPWQRCCSQAVIAIAACISS